MHYKLDCNFRQAFSNETNTVIVLHLVCCVCVLTNNQDFYSFYFVSPFVCRLFHLLGMKRDEERWQKGDKSRI